MSRKSLSDRGIAALRPRPKQRFAHPDPQLSGHYIRVTPNGGKAFVAVARGPDGKQTWATLGACDVMGIDEAREKARAAIKRIRDGLPAFATLPPKPDTFGNVAAQWLKRHVQAKGLRSEKEVARLINAHLLPRWKDRPFLDIKRSDVASMLDGVEDQHGARQADYLLAITRGIMGWFAARHDTYVPPIVKGMRRTNPKERARSRVLDDAEIRAVWKAAETNGLFGAFVRLALLTAQRRTTLAAMKWTDVAVDGTWTVVAEPRAKGTGGELVLPPMALDIIKAQPRIGDNPHVFPAARGNGHFKSYSKVKAAFDARLPADMPSWVVHDLRRSARSLLSRAGVRPDIAERTLGHALQGVAGVYDRFSYTSEKRDALAKLAALVDAIVNPRDNVLPISGATKRK